MAALKTFQRHVHLTVTILVAVLFSQIVYGSVDCSGDGSVMDTCPEGEYCEAGSCYSCSLCSVSALLQGATLTKCLCMPSSHKICVSMPESGEQLIEHPSQLFFTNLTGYENIDLAYLNESYDRSIIDCTVPTTTTTKEPTSLAVMTTTLATTLIPETPEQTSSSIQSTTKEVASSTSEPQGLNTGDLLIGILIGVAASILFAIVIATGCFVLYKKRKGHYTPVNKDEGRAGDRQYDGGNGGNAGGRDDDGAGRDMQNDGDDSGGNAEETEDNNGGDAEEIAEEEV